MAVRTSFRCEDLEDKKEEKDEEKEEEKDRVSNLHRGSYSQ